jgi:hypothetical protein
MWNVCVGVEHKGLCRRQHGRVDDDHRVPTYQQRRQLSSRTCRTQAAPADHRVSASPQAAAAPGTIPSRAQAKHVVSQSTYVAKTCRPAISPSRRNCRHQPCCAWAVASRTRTSDRRPSLSHRHNRTLSSDTRTLFAKVPLPKMCALLSLFVEFATPMHPHTSTSHSSSTLAV